MQYSTVTTGVVALSTLWGLVSGIGIGNWSGPTGVVSGDWTSTSIPSSWMPTNTKSGNWSRPTGVMSGNWSLPTGSPLPPGLLPPENMTAPANMVSSSNYLEETTVMLICVSRLGFSAAQLQVETSLLRISRIFWLVPTRLSATPSLSLPSLPCLVVIVTQLKIPIMHPSFFAMM